MAECNATDRHMMYDFKKKILFVKFVKRTHSDLINAKLFGLAVPAAFPTTAAATISTKIV